MSTKTKAKASGLNSTMGLKDYKKIEAEIIKISTLSKTQVMEKIESLRARSGGIFKDYDTASESTKLKMLLIALGTDTKVISLLKDNTWLMKLPSWTVVDAKLIPRTLIGGILS